MTISFYIQNTTPMRHKANHFLNISPSAIKLIEFAISLLNEKLKSRIFVSCVAKSFL